MEMEMEKKIQIPTELVEEILLKLPVKSLIRFSSVSKAWKSMISESWFVKRYGGRADREKFIVTSQISTVSVSSKSKSKFVVSPFSQNPVVIALCDELLLASCYHSSESLFLWNPSMNTYKRLSNPSSSTVHIMNSFYGFGYDSAADDYKILKFPTFIPGAVLGAELYSLRSDSWSDIPNFPPYSSFYNERPYNVFVSGNLHWWSRHRLNILSFDLSTHKFGEVAQPNYTSSTGYDYDRKYICVLKGMLCVCKHYYYLGLGDVDDQKSSDIWVMEEYGVFTSWTKMFTFKPFDSLSGKRFRQHVPLYIYENGELLIKTTTYDDYERGIFLYKDDKTTPQEVIIYRAKYYVHGFLYAESLVEPAMWSTTPSDSVRKL